MIGAGVGGLAAGIRLAAAGNRVTVLEAAATPGGKCGRVELEGGFHFDSGPSLITMPWVFRELFSDTGAPLEDEVELLRVEPVTRYRFADGSGFDMSADLPAAVDALEQWSPGAGADWTRFLGTCAAMWQASERFLTGPPPWPPRRPRPGDPAPDPRDLLRVKPWRTLRGLARSHCRDPRLAMVVERFATYAGADPRRAPAALALAGYVEHAFGAWHPRGGVYGLVEAMARRLEAVGGELLLSRPARAIRVSEGRVAAVATDAAELKCDAVVSAVDALELVDALLPPGERPRWTRRVRGAKRSLSGFVLMLGLSGRTPTLPHHSIYFPACYDAEFDDIFRHRRPVRDPALYVSSPSVTDPTEAPPEGESLFVLANAPPGGEGLDWNAEGERYESAVLERLAARGLELDGRIVVRARRTPVDLERETGAPGGAIYGAAPHGRLGTLRRPANAPSAPRGLHLTGGTVHPGGGLPLVLLGAKALADRGV